MIAKPKISVCMITYNHENYIEEAIKGVLMQECEYEIELIISNDSSTDGTDNIIQYILREHPKSSIIKYFNHSKNIGMMPNFIYSIKQCTGDFIALCEGDDYWTDKFKIKKQVEFMILNPEISFTFHRANILFNDKLTLSYKSKKFIDKKIVETKHFLRKGGARYCTASAVFTKSVVSELPEWLYKCHVGDYPLIFLALQKGKIGYLHDVMCVYRLASIGSWSSKNLKVYERIKNIKKMVNLNILINKKTNGNYEKYLRLNIFSYLSYKVYIETIDFIKNED
jgi:glycosyltransferase involved in cell wall biosynthesis